MWFFVVAGENVYRAAPREIAAELDHAQAAFAELARQEAGHRTTPETAQSV
jgi:hypothetical protein